jgi:hypothetical protein
MDIAKAFVINQLIDIVFSCKTIRVIFSSVLHTPLFKFAGNPGIKDRITPVRHDINIIGLKYQSDIIYSCHADVICI